jgi:hypothetical protein
VRLSGSSVTPAAIYGDAVPGSKLTADAVVQAFLKRASQPPTPAEYRIDIKLAIESWPEAVRALSFASRGFELTADERDWLASIAGECAPAAGITEEDANEKFAVIAQHPMFATIAARCDEIIDSFAEAPFCKLGTRSPKDSPYFVQFGGRVPTGGAVICNIATSWRAFEDFAIAQAMSAAATGDPGMLGGMLGKLGPKKKNPEAIDHLPWIWFREFRAWEPHQEFRCFMKDRKFVGATQYYGIDKTRDGRYMNITAFPDLVARGYEYEAAIKRFFDEQFLPATDDYVQGCVFDVIVDLDADRVTLVELNPAAPGTFPGLKDWSNPASFNGELDWADASFLPDSGTIHIEANELAAEVERRTGK